MFFGVNWLLVIFLLFIKEEILTLLGGWIEAFGFLGVLFGFAGDAVRHVADDAGAEANNHILLPNIQLIHIQLHLLVNPGLLVGIHRIPEYVPVAFGQAFLAEMNTLQAFAFLEAGTAVDHAHETDAVLEDAEVL